MSSSEDGVDGKVSVFPSLLRPPENNEDTHFLKVYTMLLTIITLHRAWLWYVFSLQTTFTLGLTLVQPA